MRYRVVSCIVFVLALAASGPAQTYADRVFRNANVITMDDARPSAGALAISGDTIVAAYPLILRRYLGLEAMCY